MRKEDVTGICSTSSRTVHADDMCGDVLNTVGYGSREILVLRSYCGTWLRLAEGAARGGNATRLAVGRSGGLCLPGSELGSSREPTGPCPVEDAIRLLGARCQRSCVAASPHRRCSLRSSPRGVGMPICDASSRACRLHRAAVPGNKGPRNRLASREASKISGPRLCCWESAASLRRSAERSHCMLGCQTAA
jgi:hypothetical protein